MRLFRKLKCIFADIVYLFCSEQLKTVIDNDVYRYLKWNSRIGKKKNRLSRLNFLLIEKPEFRSVFYFRTKHRRLLTALSGLLLPRARSVEISGEIGGGLFVSHFHSVICPKKAGKNLRVGPGAVICGEGEAPVLGNNVYVASNAVVIGNIQIGDNVIIGAGCVVENDLPGNGIYVGNPAHLVKNINDDDFLLNEIM